MVCLLLGKAMVPSKVLHRFRTTSIKQAAQATLKQPTTKTVKKNKSFQHGMKMRTLWASLNVNILVNPPINLQKKWTSHRVFLANFITMETPKCTLQIISTKNPSVRNVSFEQMGRQKSWKNLVPFTKSDNIRRGTAQLTPCHSERHGIGHEWRLQYPQGVTGIYETVKNWEYRKHVSSKINSQTLLVSLKVSSKVSSSTNMIHLHKTFTCLVLDSEWVCKGWKNLMHMDLLGN